MDGVFPDKPSETDGAFLDSPPETPAARQTLLDQLASWAAKAWAADPRSLNTLNLGNPYCPQHPPNAPYPVQARENSEHTYTRCPPLCTHFTWPAPRPCYTLVEDQVTEMKPLRAQLRKSDEAFNSQVYRGVMKSVDGQSVPVAVKIYRTSLSRAARRLSLRTQSEIWRKALQPFLAEHWAYERLKPLQGVVVPHVYGFYRVVLPGGEPAIVLITEFISTVELPEIQPKKLPLDDPEVFHKLMIGAVASAHAVGNCGVLNMDYGNANLIWHGAHVEVSADPEAAPPDLRGRVFLFPVLLDFACSRPLLREGLMQSVLLKPYISALRAIAWYGVRERVIVPWWEQNRRAGSFLARIFDAAEGELEDVAIAAGCANWRCVCG